MLTSRLCAAGVALALLSACTNKGANTPTPAPLAASGSSAPADVSASPALSAPPVASPSGRAPTTAAPSPTATRTSDPGDPPDAAARLRAAADFDGRRYDLGGLVRVVAQDSGAYYLTFDRYRVGDGSIALFDPKAAKEPRICCYTDVSIDNANNALRTVRLSRQATYLIVANLHEEGNDPCGFDVGPEWGERPLSELLNGGLAGKTKVIRPEALEESGDPAPASGAYSASAPVTLTFDKSGLVTRVRSAEGC